MNNVRQLEKKNDFIIITINIFKREKFQDYKNITKRILLAKNMNVY